MTISAFLPVFNEEKRIADALTSLMWCDEIILVDKNSTDKTLEIATGFGDKVKVYSMDNTTAYDSSEWNVFLDNCTSEWFIVFTASDVIHPKLTEKIMKKVSDVNFDYDVLLIPFRRFVLGIDSKRSPWYSELNPIVRRKSAVALNKNDVHGAIQKVSRQYKFKYDSVECMYHLTHETVDMMMDRHIRYWKGEAKAENISLYNSIKTIFKSSFRLTFLKKTFLLGHDGFMLLFSFLTYQMMSYVYQWEKARGSAPQIYSEIKKNIKIEWEVYERKS